MDYMDLLARSGEGSAHPGGFEATRRLLRRIRLPQGGRVLEVGCGTGRSACYLSRLGYDVTAVDRNPLMLEKAQRRAQRTGSRVRFMYGDAASLPFADASFDVVFVESVSVFVDGDAAFKAYHRVLKPGGVLLDRELAFTRSTKPSQCRDLVDFYGLRHLRTPRQWGALAKRCGFSSVKVPYRQGGLVPVSDADPHQEIDPSLFEDRQAAAMFELNRRLLHKYRKRTATVLIWATK